MARLLLFAGLISAVAALFIATRGEEVRAAGPCGTTHDAVDSEEQEFLQVLQSWRATSGVSNEPVQLSGALNKAAAWFAEWQIANGAPGGHHDSSGRNWVQRAIDCGYTGQTSGGQNYASGSGEGIYAVAGSSLPNVGPQQALQGMISQGPGHSGIYMSGSQSLPAKCYGVAVRRSNNAVAWVVVIAQYPAAGSCPGGSGRVATATSTTATASATATSTATPTSTPTATPTATPSPTPTPRADGAAVTLYEGWNLVTLPAGPVTQVLARADGCYRAIYQQQGDRWLRYSPDVPAYANNLQTLNGGAFWVEGTAEDCGLIQL